MIIKLSQRVSNWWKTEPSINIKERIEYDFARDIANKILRKIDIKESNPIIGTKHNPDDIFGEEDWGHEIDPTQTEFSSEIIVLTRPQFDEILQKIRIIRNHYIPGAHETLNAAIDITRILQE